MWSLIIIYFVISFATLPIAVKNTNDSIKNNSPRLPIWWMGLLLVLAILIIVIPIMSSKYTVNQAEKMASFNDGNSIYYDNDNDEYFILHQNDFKIFPMYEKHKIDTEMAERKLYIKEHEYDGAFEDVESFEEWKVGAIK